MNTQFWNRYTQPIKINCAKIKRNAINKYNKLKYKTDDIGLVEFLKTNFAAMDQQNEFSPLTGIATPQPKFNKKIIDRLCRKLWQYKDILGLQPMSGPVGLTYFLRYKNQQTENGSSTELISLEVVKQAVEARTARLKTKFSMEAWQDAANVSGVSTLDIISIISDEVFSEIMQQHALNMHKISGNRYEFTISESHNQKLMGLEPKPTKKKDSSSVELDELRTLINAVSNEIAKNTRRGAGNNIFIPLSLLPLFNEYREFKPNQDFNHLGLVGTLNKIYNVYVIGYTGNNIIISYSGKSSTTIDTGFYYCPYNVLISTGVVVDPLTYQPTVNLMTRYGVSYDEDSKNYYSVIEIKTK